MKQVITETYVDFETAKALDRLGFNKVVSKNICMPWYTQHGFLIKYDQDLTNFQPSTLPLIPAPSIGVVLKWLRVVYRAILIPTPIFGNKIGYDTWEVLGWRIEDHVMTEENGIMLTYSDFNNEMLSSKYANNPNDMNGELVQEEWLEELRSNPELALKIAIRERVEWIEKMISTGNTYWAKDLEERKKEFEEKKAVHEFPEYVLFHSFSGNPHSLFKKATALEDNLVLYKGYLLKGDKDTECKISIMFGELRVVDSNKGVYLNKQAYPIKDSEKIDVWEKLMRQYAKEDE